MFRFYIRIVGGAAGRAAPSLFRAQARVELGHCHIRRRQPAPPQDECGSLAAATGKQGRQEERADSWGG